MPRRPLRLVRLPYECSGFILFVELCLPRNFSPSYVLKFVDHDPFGQSTACLLRKWFPS